MSCIVAASVDVLTSSLEVARSTPDEHTFFFFSIFTPITDPGLGVIAAPRPAWGGGTPGYRPITKKPRQIALTGLWGRWLIIA